MFGVVVRSRSDRTTTPNLFAPSPHAGRGIGGGASKGTAFQFVMFVTLESISFGDLYNDFRANFLYTLSIVQVSMRSAMTTMVPGPAGLRAVASHRSALELFPMGNHNDRHRRRRCSGTEPRRAAAGVAVCRWPHMCAPAGSQPAQRSACNGASRSMHQPHAGAADVAAGQPALPCERPSRSVSF